MCSSDMTLTERNFDTLHFGTKPLANLAVDDQGLLCYQDVSVFSRVSQWFSASKDAKEKAKQEAEKVNEAILDVLSDLSERFGEFQTRKQAVGTEELEKLLLLRLREAPSALYNPNALRNYKNLQYLLVPELEELEKAGPPETEERQLDLAVAKAKLMFKIGVGIEYNTGSTGSFRVEWFGGRPLGIFKPENSRGQLTKKIVNYVNWLLGNQESHLSAADKARPSAEVAAHLIDRFLKVGITCPTRMVEMESMEGSFQLFDHELKNAEKIRPSLDNKAIADFHDREILLFGRMTALDYLFGGFDRHDKNWMVQELDETCLIGFLRLIDNANSFPNVNPKNSKPHLLSDVKQYHWQDWKLAKVPYPDEVRELMRSFSDDLATQMINLVRSELPDFWELDMMNLFYQRAAVLRTLGRLKDLCPRDLGRLQTDDEILTFLKQPFQEMYIYNYFLGDFVENADVWLENGVSESDDLGIALQAIHEHNSFLQRGPNRKNNLESKLNPWGDWRAKDQAFCEMTFTPKSLQLMKALNEETIEKLVAHLRLQLGEDCNEVQLEALTKRAKVLNALAYRDEISPKDLENLLDDESVELFLMTSDQIMSDFVEL